MIDSYSRDGSGVRLVAVGLPKRNGRWGMRYLAVRVSSSTSSMAANNLSDWIGLVA